MSKKLYANKSHNLDKMEKMFEWNKLQDLLKMK